MTLRTLFAFLLASVLLASIVIIIGIAAFMQSSLANIIPASEHDALRVLLIGQAGAGFFFSLILIAALFSAVNAYFVAPLRKLITAMEAFTVRGEEPVIPDLAGAPRELRRLGSVFGEFVARMSETHKKDVEISRVKSDFISTAAHQFRTPLTGIRWALEALQKESLTEAQAALVKSAVDKSHDLVGIVGTLLDISAIESGKYKYAFTSVDIAALLAEVAQDFGPLAGKAAVSLFYAKEGDEVPPVRADRERIKWVLNNLVENALKYTPAGGTVRLSTEGADGKMLIRVKDTGIGIPAEDRGNIFERFYRAENAAAKENAGNGLGLYIARTIAQDHGGELHFVGNEDGPGTTFILSLPIAA